MNIGQSFSLAVKSLMASKLRALLTMLGIIIGVAAVILIVSLGNGVTEEVQNTFNSLGSNIVTAMAVYQNNSKYIKLDKLQEFVDQNENIAYYSPYTTHTTKVKYGNDDMSTTINGINEEYMTIRDRGISSGRGFQYLDVERQQKVCIVGSYIVEKLFDVESDDEVVGKQIKINGNNFKIVGVLEEKAGSTVGGEDDLIFIPYTVAQKIFNQENIGSFYFTYADSEHADEVVDAIDKYFYKVYEDTDYYIIIDAQSMMESMYDMLDTVNTVLVAIAAISLFVGGIGIMNIMLVSVTERTKEIGIRKAIGANKRDILSQFVIEAITTSSIGGVIGIVLGLSLSYLTAIVFDLKTSVTIGSVLIAVGISCLIGIVFGYLPASKAAKMHPIDALRYE